MGAAPRALTLVAVGWPFRITTPLLDVVEALVHADTAVHGWALAEQTGQSGPNVYRALARLRAAGWVWGRREARNPESGRPPRCSYRLTARGSAQARLLLEERRGPRQRSGALS